jgi:hypothetical protein
MKRYFASAGVSDMPISGRATVMAAASLADLACLRRSKTMNEDSFNTSIRKFLKMVGVRSQSEIERAVASAIAQGKLKGNETFPARMQLTIDEIKLNLTLDGDIRLE